MCPFRFLRRISKLYKLPQLEWPNIADSRKGRQLKDYSPGVSGVGRGSSSPSFGLGTSAFPVIKMAMA